MRTGLFLLSMVCWLSCAKEYSYEGSGNTAIPINPLNNSGRAVFSFPGAPNTCTTATVNGSYVQNKQLSIAETVDLLVDVTAIGQYTISTDTLNGISFTGSGFFTATGKQVVSLLGSGVPERADNILYTPAATGINGCTFQVSFINAEPIATYVLESGSGTPSPCIATVMGNYYEGGLLTTTNHVIISVYVALVGNYTIATDIVNGMRFYSTGTFTKTGVQQVILAGKGTPRYAGSFTLIPSIVGPHPLGGQSCGFYIPVF
ncbi:MAG: hypothetical protein RLZZ28_183 [Bacteroidota bacterium]